MIGAPPFNGEKMKTEREKKIDKLRDRFSTISHIWEGREWTPSQRREMISRIDMQVKELRRIHAQFRKLKS